MTPAAAHSTRSRTDTPGQWLDPGHVPKVGFFLGIGLGTMSLSLDFDAVDLCYKKGPMAEKLGMVVALSIFPCCDSLESIQIQLPLKGGSFGKVEIFAEHMVNDFGFVQDEASSVWLPTDNMCMSIALHLLQHMIEFERKGNVTGCQGHGIVGRR